MCNCINVKVIAMSKVIKKTEKHSILLGETNSINELKHILMAVETGINIKLKLVKI